MLTNFKDGAKLMSCQFHFDHLVLTMGTGYRVKQTAPVSGEDWQCDVETQVGTGRVYYVIQTWHADMAVLSGS